MSPTAFRALIVCSVVAGLAGSALDALVPDLLAAELSAAINNQPPPRFVEDHPFAVFVPVAALALASIAGAIGLLFYKRWARSLSLWATLGLLAMLPFFGSTAASGWTEALMELSSMTWGAVLALAYFSPLAARFGKAGQAAPT